MKRQTSLGLLKLHDDTVEEYTVYSDSGTIAEPGKFEGETLLTPYLYALSLDGSADECEYDGESLAWESFKIDDTMREQFPWIADDETIAYLFFSESGFLSSDTATEDK